MGSLSVGYGKKKLNYEQRDMPLLLSHSHLFLSRLTLSPSLSLVTWLVPLFSFRFSLRPPNSFSHSSTLIQTPLSKNIITNNENITEWDG